MDRRPVNYYKKTCIMYYVDMEEAILNELKHF